MSDPVYLAAATGYRVYWVCLSSMTRTRTQVNGEFPTSRRSVPDKLMTDPEQDNAMAPDRNGIRRSPQSWTPAPGRCSGRCPSIRCGTVCRSYSGRGPLRHARPRRSGPNLGDAALHTGRPGSHRWQLQSLACPVREDGKDEEDTRKTPGFLEKPGVWFEDVALRYAAALCAAATQDGALRYAALLRTGPFDELRTLPRLATAAV